MKYLPRDAETILLKLSKEYPILAITGPRQSGKTTIVKKLFKKKPYVSLENPDLREMAENDPRSFLLKYKDGAIFDEIQRTPQLFSYLQEVVDQDDTVGRFILTGSQQFGLLSSITQSLAGRVALIRLLPFSYHECYSKSHTAFIKDLDHVLFNGLYPSCA